MTAPPRYACRTCGQWICDQCGWRRSGASVRYTDHSCARCGCTTGEMLPTMHNESMWREHNANADWDVPLPTGHPYGVQAPPDDAPGDFGTRAAGRAPTVYQGVPAPRQGPYQRLDIKSWQRGVDDALKATEGQRKQAMREGYDIGYKAAKGEGS